MEPVQSPVPLPSRPQNIILYLLLVIIFLLMSIIAGGSYYLINLPKYQPQIEINQQVPELEEDLTPNNGRENPAPTIPLNFTKSQNQKFEVSLDKVILGEKIVTLNFTAKNISDRMETFPSNTADLAKSYLTNEVSSLKYEVIKDTANKPLVSTIEYKWLQVGEKYSFYIQFSAPEKGALVDINIPNILPMVGVKVE